MWVSHSTLICLIQSLKYLPHTSNITPNLVFLCYTFLRSSNIQHSHILWINSYWLRILNFFSHVFFSSYRAIWYMIVFSFFRNRVFLEFKLFNIKSLTSFYRKMSLSFILLIREHLFLTCWYIDSLLDFLYFLLKALWAWGINCWFGTFYHIILIVFCWLLYFRKIWTVEPLFW